MSPWLVLLRPAHALKNVFLFLPIFFEGYFFESQALLNCCFAFGAFSLVTMSIYIMNDIVDSDTDRKHPLKKSRPIAAGHIQPSRAAMIAFLLLVLGLTFIGQLSLIAAGYALLYLVLNVLYTFKLKQIPILSLTGIGTGFVLRLFIGCSVTNVPHSPWLILLIFMMTVWIAVGKRYMESWPQTQVFHWELSLLRWLGSVLLLFYLLHLYQSPMLNMNLVWLFGLACIGLGRMRYIIHRRSRTQYAITQWLTDKPLGITALGWFTMNYMAIY